MGSGKALNEGRGRDPGDTSVFSPPFASLYTAQRRPGPRPRRHNEQGVGAEAVFPRSTKAGAETPATHPRPVATLTCATTAQRRPGPRPRRHPRRHPRRRHHDRRSTKAGAETPATRWTRSMRRWASSGRSTKAGAETPATQDAARQVRHRARTLNEGRGRDPGDTPLVPPGLADILRRSTKAGAETPATRGCQPRRRTGDRRSTKAGAETPATRRSERGNELGGRSTKAGAETPATLGAPPGT